MGPVALRIFLASVGGTSWLWTSRKLPDKDLRAAQMKGPLAVAIHEVKTTLPLLLASARGGPFIKVSQKGLEWNMRTVGKDVQGCATGGFCH
jgi:hypothetical protein